MSQFRKIVRKLLRESNIFKSFNESVKLLNKDFSDTRLITSPYEVNEYLKNNNESRVVYDKYKKWYIIDGSGTSIHYDMIRDAMVDGLYIMNDGFGRMMDGTKYEDGQDYYREHKDDFVIFRTSSDINNDEDFVYDDYRYSYEYKDYCVFDRNNDFPQTTLYKILGKPIAVNCFSDEDFDENVNTDDITFEPTDEKFVIGGKDFADEYENCKIYKINCNNIKIGMLALTEFPDGIELNGLEIDKPYRRKGYGKKVVDILKRKYKGIYVRSIPSAKNFWKKQGHDAYWNDDSGTYDGDLVYETVNDSFYQYSNTDENAIGMCGINVRAEQNDSYTMIIDMSPQEFLSLSTPNFIKDDVQWFEEQVKQGIPLAMPYLEIEIENPEKKIARVYGHEGRHRSLAIANLGYTQSQCILWIRDFTRAGYKKEDLIGWTIMGQKSRSGVKNTHENNSFIIK